MCRTGDQRVQSRSGPGSALWLVPLCAEYLGFMWQASVGAICPSYSFEQVVRHVETGGKPAFLLVKISAGGNERISCCWASQHLVTVQVK